MKSLDGWLDTSLCPLVGYLMTILVVMVMNSILKPKQYTSTIKIQVDTQRSNLGVNILTARFLDFQVDHCGQNQNRAHKEENLNT